MSSETIKIVTCDFCGVKTQVPEGGDIIAGAGAFVHKDDEREDSLGNGGPMDVCPACVKKILVYKDAEVGSSVTLYKYGEDE